MQVSWRVWSQGRSLDEFVPIGASRVMQLTRQEVTNSRRRRPPGAPAPGSRRATSPQGAARGVEAQLAARPPRRRPDPALPGQCRATHRTDRDAAVRRRRTIMSLTKSAPDRRPRRGVLARAAVTLPIRAQPSTEVREGARPRRGVDARGFWRRVRRPR